MLAFKSTETLPLHQSHSNLLGKVVISSINRTAQSEAMPAQKATGLVAPGWLFPSDGREYS